MYMSTVVNDLTDIYIVHKMMIEMWKGYKLDTHCVNFWLYDLYITVIFTSLGDNTECRGDRCSYQWEDFLPVCTVWCKNDTSL